MNKKRQLILTTFLVRTTYFGVGISYCLKYGKNLTILMMLLGMILGYFLLNILLSCNLTKFFKTKIGSNRTKQKSAANNAIVPPA